MGNPRPKLQFITPTYAVKSPKEIVGQIEKLRTEITDAVGNLGPSSLTTPLVLSKHTDIIYLISRLTEISTRRIVRLTFALVLLTGMLLVFTIVLYKDTHALVQREQSTQKRELQKPTSPEPKP